MQFGIISSYQEFNTQNRIFNPASYKLGDSLADPVIDLREYLKSLGHEITTLDLCDLALFDAVLFLDFPTKSEGLLERLRAAKKRLVLLLLESEMIKPDNYDIRNHHWFEVILTYKPELIGLGGKYRKQLLAHSLRENFDSSSVRLKKIVLISSNKISSEPGELYSERLEAIRYLEKRKVDSFELYGFGWDRRQFRSRFVRKLAKMTGFDRALSESHPAYRGVVTKKYEVMQQFDFCICYENSDRYENYVTEKIFDCFVSGVIPIYLGAPNIGQLIPAETFVDRRQFASMKELTDHLLGLSYSEVLSTRRAISSYLKDSGASPFSLRTASENIAQGLIVGNAVLSRQRKGNVGKGNRARD